MKQDIQNKEDLALLVETFYGKVRAHKELGPIFNRFIKDWEAHLRLLTNFWETNIFIKSSYKGNPMQIHKMVDQYMGHTITQEHFSEWLRLWVSTLQELFDPKGQNAIIAKNRAANMATYMHINIVMNRKKQPPA